MRFLILIAVIAAPLPAAPAFRLDAGEYRWKAFTLTQVPAEVECRFEVVKGNATVHVELLPMSEFRLFSRAREHKTLATSPRSQAGAFRRIVEEPGQYAVVAVNDKGAPPAMVSLEVTTDLNPRGRVVARELPPGRRLAVISISFALFFAMVTWSGVKLVKGIKS